MANGKTVETRKCLYADVQRACDAALHRCTMHTTLEFTGSDHAHGIVICWVSCPDNVAGKLHASLDRAVEATLAESGWCPQPHSAVRS